MHGDHEIQTAHHRETVIASSREGIPQDREGSLIVLAVLRLIQKNQQTLGTDVDGFIKKIA